MLDDLALILTSIGSATAAIALLRRRTRRAPSTIPLAPVSPGPGARHLAGALCAAAEPLRIAGPSWKSLAETLQLEPGDLLDCTTARDPR